MGMTERKRKVKIILNNGFKYEGELLSEDADFIEIHDEISGDDMTINKKETKIIQRLKEETEPWKK